MSDFRVGSFVTFSNDENPTYEIIKITNNKATLKIICGNMKGSCADGTYSEKSIMSFGIIIPTYNTWKDKYDQS